jgi:CBS-domain-containing membrane protein
VLKQAQLGLTGSVLIISSLGASAVLLFAVPHGALSQPWPVIGGHMISAFIGVCCQQWLPEGFMTAGIAVGLAVGAMYYLRCIHPPGGASALTAVIGGSEISEMGYQFLLYPLLLNVAVMLAIALSFNFLFPWRRYPAHFNTRQISVKQSLMPTSDYVLTTEDFNAAIHELDSFVDITEEGLTELLEKARQHAQLNIRHPENIERGRFYSNGNIGSLWGVRQVIDDAERCQQGRDLIIYKTVAGQNLYQTGYCDRESFRQWARFEVIETQGLWVKADHQS